MPRARALTSRSVVPLLRLVVVSLLAWRAGPAPAQVVLVSSDFSDSVPMYDLAGNSLGYFVPPRRGGLDSPQGIAVGPDGNVYVSSAVNDRVIRYSGTTGAFLNTFVSGGRLDQPWYLTFGPDGDLYVSSSLTNEVLCYDGTTGAFKRVAASGGGLFRPDGISFAADGTMLVSQFFVMDSRIKRFDPATGAFIEDVVDDPGLSGALEHRLSPDGSTLFVSSFATNSVRTYSVATGDYLGDYATAPLNGPVGQLPLPDGSLLISSWNDSSIYRFDLLSGGPLGTFTSGGLINHPNNMVLLTTIPEPSVIGGTLALALVMGRIRSRRSSVRPVRRHRRAAQLSWHTVA